MQTKNGKEAAMQNFANLLAGCLAAWHAAHETPPYGREKEKKTTENASKTEQTPKKT